MTDRYNCLWSVTVQKSSKQAVDSWESKITMHAVQLEAWTVQQNLIIQLNVASDPAHSNPCTILHTLMAVHWIELCMYIQTHASHLFLMKFIWVCMQQANACTEDAGGMISINHFTINFVMWHCILSSKLISLSAHWPTVNIVHNSAHWPTVDLLHNQPIGLQYVGICLSLKFNDYQKLFPTAIALCSSADN